MSEDNRLHIPKETAKEFGMIVETLCGEFVETKKLDDCLSIPFCLKCFQSEITVHKVLSVIVGEAELGVSELFHSFEFQKTPLKLSKVLSIEYANDPTP